MKVSIKATLAVVAIFLGGCASTPQQPIELSKELLTSKSSRVGIVMTDLPKVDTQFPGASCLLCYAAASAANSTLTQHTQSLPYEDLPKIKNDVADLMRKKGIEAVVISESLKLHTLSDSSSKAPNAAPKDFSAFKQKYQIDKLVVIDISSLGVERTYSAYIPTSDPKAVLKGKGYVVNLSNNTYEWYLPVEIAKSADAHWDEPPKFPGLTNAYFQALEIGKDSFEKPFVN